MRIHENRLLCCCSLKMRGIIIVVNMKNILTFICSTFTGLSRTDKIDEQDQSDGSLPRLVDYLTGIAELMGSTPEQTRTQFIFAISKVAFKTVTTSLLTAFLHIRMFIQKAIEKTVSSCCYVLTNKVAISLFNTWHEIATEGKMSIGIPLQRIAT